MTEDEARAYVVSLVPRETMKRLDVFTELLRKEATSQNLVAGSTLGSLWARHIADSAQLLLFDTGAGIWADLGSGAGLPGLVIAAMRSAPTTLIEPRTKRAAFLAEAADRMGLADRVTVIKSRAETAPPSAASVISARAVANLSDLFAMGGRHARPSTVWILPKGRSAADEVALAEKSWQADIQLVPSITDSEAAIIVARNVSSRKGRGS